MTAKRMADATSGIVPIKKKDVSRKLPESAKDITHACHRR